VASLLLTNGAEVNQADTNGFTPLHVACLNGGLALVQLLSSYDASRTLSNSKMAEQVVGLRGDNEVVD
jgi:ankyrin repeat protein